VHTYAAKKKLRRERQDELCQPTFGAACSSQIAAAD
jgi:hypothetical protein